MVESIIEQHVDDPQLQQEVRIILNIYTFKDYEMFENRSVNLPLSIANMRNVDIEQYLNLGKVGSTQHY